MIQMPISDPRAGRAFIWIVSSLLFLSLLIGGGCLVMYMILPPTDTTSWLPVAGVALVCLPWSFWFLTILYRIISRFFFSRVSPAGGERARVGPAVGAQATASESACVNGGNDVNLDQFGTATTVEDEERKGGHRKKDRRRSNSSSSNGSSESHESEMALAISMGS